MNYLTDWVAACFYAAQSETVWVGVGLLLAVSVLVLASELYPAISGLEIPSGGS